MKALSLLYLNLLVYRHSNKKILSEGCGKNNNRPDLITSVLSSLTILLAKGLSKLTSWNSSTNSLLIRGTLLLLLLPPSDAGVGAIWLECCNPKEAEEASCLTA